MADTPMLDKMIAVRDQSQAIGEFLDWLRSSTDDGGAGLEIARWETRRECGYSRDGRGSRPGYDCRAGTLQWDDGSGPVLDDHDVPEKCEACDGRGWVERVDPVLAPAQQPIERLLADYFDIDLNAVDRERQAVLDEIRAKQEEAQGG